MKVAKFGGSSVANAEQLKKEANIIQADEERRIIVVSAPGKRNSEDIKVTDLLIELGEAYRLGESHEAPLKNVLDRFDAILEELELSKAVLADIEQQVVKIFDDGN